MKRHGNLWDRMISFENLLLAATAAARGKRFKTGVARFFFRLGRELLRLHEELASRTYGPGRYRTFTIYEGKVKSESNEICPSRQTRASCRIVLMSF